LLVDLTRQEQAVAGARMMGGGFGGCTLNLIKSSAVEKVVSEMTKRYKETTSIEADVYRVKVADGVQTLESI